jgi:uncharacterized membrane protein
MNDMTLAVWLVHVAATLFLVGLIWVIQVVHYPLFAEVGHEQFATYEQRHTRLITWIVAPSMLAEGLTGGVLLLLRPSFVPLAAVVGGFMLMLVNWLSTAIVQIPDHERLVREFSTSIHQRLVRTNWLRTIAWSLRGVMVVWVTFVGLRAHT